MRPEPSDASSEPGARRDFLTVDGMFCAACAASLEALLNRYPGVRSAAVNFAAEAAVVDWTPVGDDRKRLLQRVQSLGYRARLIGDADSTEQSAADPKRDLGLRLVVALFFGMWAMLPSVTLYFDAVADPATRLRLALAAGVFALPVIAYSGVPFYRMGLLTLRHGIAGVDALILLGVAGSVLLSVSALARGSADVFFEVAIALVTLQLVGRMLDLRVRRRARDAVTSLFELAPTTVRMVTDAGEERNVVLKDVVVGQRIRVRPGERLAVDGNVVDGSALVDRSLLSGESIPAHITTPAALHAGERILDGVVVLKVTAAVGKRRIDELARQVRHTLTEKPPWQRAVDRAAGYFLWIAACAAMVGSALVLTGGGTPVEAGARALSVFVIACPCALSLAAPLAGLAASGGAARQGMILRDLNAITAGAVPSRLFVDKTGTLTEGTPRIAAIHPFGSFQTADVLEIAAVAERDSEHPVAQAIKAQVEDGGSSSRVATAEGFSRIVPGRGVVWTSSTSEIRVGQPAWLATEGISLPSLSPTTATRVGVTFNGQCAGFIDLEDRVRPGMDHMVDVLRQRGIEPVILSGDAEAPVSLVANKLGVTAIADLTPEEKAGLINDAQRLGHAVAFAGDGLNDAPALAAADLGIAVGRSTDAARTAAAVVFVDTDASALPTLFDLTARTRTIIRQNLGWAIAYNVIAIPAAVVGWVHPAIAAVAMALSSMTIVLNALRAGRVRTS